MSETGDPVAALNRRTEFEGKDESSRWHANSGVTAASRPNLLTLELPPIDGRIAPESSFGDAPHDIDGDLLWLQIIASPADDTERSFASLLQALLHFHQ